MTRATTRTPAPRQRSPLRPVSRPHDPAEREADRAADTVARGGSVTGWSFSSVPVSAGTPVHRDDIGPSRTAAEKKSEALSKAGDAFFETAPGKALKARVLRLPVVRPVKEKLSTPAGKALVVGAAGAGVAGLAATGRPLPVQLPSFNVRMFGHEFLTHVTVLGPLDRPTSAMVTLTLVQPTGAGRRRPTEPADGPRGGGRQEDSQEIIDEVVAEFGRRRLGQEPLTIPLGTVPAEDSDEAPVQKSPTSTTDTGPSHVQVDHALGRGGRPLDGGIRRSMEARFGYDFSSVRIHDDSRAAAAAAAVDAAAFTVGDHIAFGTGRYAPSSPAGHRLLAHELAHVVQQDDLPQAHHVAQRAPAEESTTKTDDKAPAKTQAAGAGIPCSTPAKRKDYVFIMGEDRAGTSNQFYAMATRFFSAKLPDAVLLPDKRSLSEVLDYIRHNVTAPIGTLYMVSHANEDGTLGFGLDPTSAAADPHLPVTVLRDALHPKSGATKLANVRGKVDAGTRIEIKGCDLGRTREMVELIDEAFGGEGGVTAGTHEQRYLVDQEMGDQAGAAFRKGVAAKHPETGPVDPTLKGGAKKQAQAERAVKEGQRKKDLAADIKAHADEEAKVVEAARLVEALSGPMFQRPGSKLFSLTELQSEVDSIYGHLDKATRAALARALLAPDPRPAAQIERDGVVGQQGQHLYRFTPATETYADPKNVTEARAAFREVFAQNDFTPSTMAQSDPGTFEFSGTITKPGQAPVTGPLILVSRPDNSQAELIATARTMLNNPGRYAFRFVTTHDKAAGTTTNAAVAERVVAYLHHRLLDASAHDHFLPPDTDPTFFYKSKFAPAAAATGGATP